MGITICASKLNSDVSVFTTKEIFDQIFYQIDSTEINTGLFIITEHDMAHFDLIGGVETQAYIEILHEFFEEQFADMGAVRGICMLTKCQVNIQQPYSFGYNDIFEAQSYLVVSDFIIDLNGRIKPKYRVRYVDEGGRHVALNDYSEERFTLQLEMGKMFAEALTDINIKMRNNR